MQKILPDRGDIKGRHPYIQKSSYRSGGFSAISEATILKTLTAKE